MSCTKHHESINSYCQLCSVFICTSCPSHEYHSIISYSVYISQHISEIQAYARSSESKEKLLEMLSVRIFGYLTSLDKNKENGYKDLKSATEALHKALNERYEQLLKEIDQITDNFTKPLAVFNERIKGYLLQIKNQIKSSESVIQKLSSSEAQDPILIENEIKKLKMLESGYVDTFITTCKKSLEAKIPVIPIVEKNILSLESAVYLDYNSKQLEEKPIFPY